MSNKKGGAVMARPREPINLLEAKGKKHLTKSDKESRKAAEIKVPYDKVIPPDYLSQKEKKEFEKISSQLIELRIMSNLDCDAVARYIQSESKYLAYDKMVNQNLSQIEKSSKLSDESIVDIGVLKDLESLRDKALKQCRASASDLGLTISSRCKLVVPKKEEAPASKWDSYKAGGAGGG